MFSRQLYVVNINVGFQNSYIPKLFIILGFSQISCNHIKLFQEFRNILVQITKCCKYISTLSAVVEVED